jgi:hypothetical protein
VGTDPVGILEEGTTSMIRRGSYANVASTLALIVALGGTSYAAVAIPKNSVGSAEIENSSITSKDVKNGALKGVDFKAGELPAGAQGPAGPAGAAGPAGPAGPAGSARAFAYVGTATPSLLRAKGFTAVRRASTGLYCLTLPGIDLTQIVPLVSVDYRLSASPEGNGSAMWDSFGCNAGEMGVRTERINDPYAAAAPADNVAFTVLVP